MNDSLPQPAPERVRNGPDQPARAAQWDLITALVFLALGLAVMIESWRMPRFEELEVNPYTVPGLVPGLLGGVLAFLALILMIRAGRAGGCRFKGWPRQARGFLRRPETAQLGWTLVLTVGYAGGLVGRVHFGLATFLFVTLFILVFEWRAGRCRREKAAWIRIGLAMAQGVIVAVAVTLVFERVFLVRLP